MNYEIVLKEKTTAKDLAIIDDGISEHQERIFGKVARGGLLLLMKKPSGEVVGGVSGFWNAFGWLYVNSLWVSDDVRGNGYGKQLMERIEAEAVGRGCKNAYLNTMSFQAPEFYKKLGYTVFGELEDFPTGHSRIFLRKSL